MRVICGLFPAPPGKALWNQPPFFQLGSPAVQPGIPFRPTGSFSSEYRNRSCFGSSSEKAATTKNPNHDCRDVLIGCTHYLEKELKIITDGGVDIIVIDGTPAPFLKFAFFPEQPRQIFKDVLDKYQRRLHRKYFLNKGSPLSGISKDIFSKIYSERYIFLYIKGD